MKTSALAGVSIALGISFALVISDGVRPSFGATRGRHNCGVDVYAGENKAVDNKDNRDNKGKDKTDKPKDEPSNKDGEPGDTDEAKKQLDQTQGKILPKGATIIVGDRTLTGPFSSPQMRGSRIFLPVVSIARTLGDKIDVNPAARTVEVLRQTGVVAEFSGPLNQVRENGAAILVVSNTADIVFSPNPEELMLPVEIVAPLLDVSIVVDDAARSIRIMRGHIQANTVRDGTEHSSWEIYQIDYAYNLNQYSNSFYHNFTFDSTGRIGDGRFSLIMNLDGGTNQGPLIYRRGSFSFDRPNGQRLIAGDFGTGNDLAFMSSTVRGAWAQHPLSNKRMTVFAGRAVSGALPQTLTPTGPPINPRKQFGLGYDTTVIGSYLTFGPSANKPTGPKFLSLSSGLMYFNGPEAAGELATGSIKYSSRRHQLQGDVGFGYFSGVVSDRRRVEGIAPVVDISEVFKLSGSFTLQGRYTRISPNFLGPQSSGSVNAVDLKAGGFSWQPWRWLSTSLTGSATKRLDIPGEDSNSVTATISVTPRGFLPTLLFAHTKNNNSVRASSEYTLMNATKEFNGWRLFANYIRIQGPPPLTTAVNDPVAPPPLNSNLSVGTMVKIRGTHILQASQSFGSKRNVGGDLDWATSAFFSKRISVGVGVGYNYDQSKLTTVERLHTTLQLPRKQVLQVSYVKSQLGPQLLVQMRGPLFSSRKAEAALHTPLAEIKSLGACYGKVYQDVNLNGHFDAGVDKPQAEVKVRVDGNFYAVTDQNGDFRVDNVKAGEHVVHMDLLTVRADLTLLDSPEQTVVLKTGRDAIVDFRLVRTGRIKGNVWNDVNGNGKLDDEEQPLGDVRVVTASGRDTLTDAQGEFVLGDLPPGEHIVLVDEKTLPENTKSAIGSLQVLVKAASETSNVDFPIVPKPQEINVKRFPPKDP